METTPFDLTLKQKNLLAALAQETGQPISALLDEALEALQERRYLDHASAPQTADKPIWGIADELFGAIPDEELARLPVDGAAQHDHYLYGLPKRSP
jgi:hypothetical protein